MDIDRVAILVKKASLEFDKLANPIFKDYDISPAQYKVMKYIYDEYESGVRLVDLERYCSMTHPTAIGLVNNLEKKGFLEYKDNPNHARSRLIFPTKKALKMEKELEQAGKEIDNMITSNLSKKEKEELTYLLKKMLHIENEVRE